MRDRVIHVYFDIDIEAAWKTAAVRLPELARRNAR
jgi:uncharacterized protein with HEPN domain